MANAAPHLQALLRRGAARVGTLHALSGAAIGVALAAIGVATLALNATETSAPSLLTRSLALCIAGAVTGAAAGWWRSSTTRARIAIEIDQRVPDAHNLLVTANELLTEEGTTHRDASVSSIVLERAERLSARVELAPLFPSRNVSIACALSAALWLGVTLIGTRAPGALSTAPIRSAMSSLVGRSEIQQVAVRIVPPVYTRQSATLLRDPQRIDALAGSTVSLTITASSDSVEYASSFGTDTLSQVLGRSADGTFVLSVPATRDGYIALQPIGTNNNGERGARRLIGITVQEDNAPRVRIVAPARDLILPDANRTLDVRIEADDDLALGSLRLRYTKVAGSGERFTFSEGEVNVAVNRASATSWSARASLALAALLNDPGDLVVYRAVATDSRPGAPAIESDAFIAELAAPGGVAALGFSLDPDEDRYALSQQMVIQKTERLIAKRATMTPEALAEESAQLAGEQRRVRAEFVFMMGGEFAQQVAPDDVTGDLDETHEAESEGDLSDGRMVNRGRTSLLAAVRAMSRAAVALTVADLAPALANEKTALTQLQDAFARQRFLMRALSQREQLDPTRRLTGKLDSIARGAQAIPTAARDEDVAAWRAILAGLTNVSATGSNARTEDAARVELLAERVLQIDPSGAAAQRIAAQLSAAADLARRNANTTQRSARESVLLDSATVGIARQLRTVVRPSAPAGAPAELRRLQSALDAAARTASTSATGRP